MGRKWNVTFMKNEAKKRKMPMRMPWPSRISVRMAPGCSALAVTLPPDIFLFPK